MKAPSDNLRPAIAAQDGKSKEGYIEDGPEIQEVYVLVLAFEVLRSGSRNPGIRYGEDPYYRSAEAVRRKSQ